MKDIVAHTLCPNCSEYIFHLVLTPEEKKIALEMTKEIGKENDEYFLEHFNETEEGNTFTNADYAKDYIDIKTVILAKREGIEIDKLKELARKLK